MERRGWMAVQTPLMAAYTDFASQADSNKYGFTGTTVKSHLEATTLTLFYDLPWLIILISSHLFKLLWQKTIMIYEWKWIQSLFGVGSLFIFEYDSSVGLDDIAAGKSNGTYIEAGFKLRTCSCTLYCKIQQHCRLEKCLRPVICLARSSSLNVNWPLNV